MPMDRAPFDTDRAAPKTSRRGEPVTVEVYTWEPDANSGKPLLCLHEKQVPFVHQYVDIGAREHHEPAFLAINPAGTVPALVHDGLVLTESTPMMEYIDDAFDGPPLRPADPALRWRMRWIMRVIDHSVCPALAMIASKALAGRFRDMPEADKQAALAKIPDPERRRNWDLLMHEAIPPAELAESQHRVADGLALLERTLGKYPYLAGSAFSLADICAMATCYHLPVSRPDEVSAARTPRLWRWLRRCHARPGLQAGFAMGRGSITGRALQAREALGV
jgi:glutathione S-transferase/GST-like protein